MKKETVTLSMEAEKLRAIRRYMAKKDADMEQELGDALQKLYEKYVPGPVREYIDEGGDELTAAIPKKKQKEKNNGAEPFAPTEVL